MPIDDRRFQRYSVLHSDSIRGDIVDSQGSLQLVSLGLGGCGFTGSDHEMRLIPPKQVTCLLSVFENERMTDAFQVTGKLIYVRPANVMNASMYFGIAFSEKDHGIIKPIISNLESLVKRGLIDRA